MCHLRATYGSAEVTRWKFTCTEGLFSDGGQSQNYVVQPGSGLLLLVLLLAHQPEEQQSYNIQRAQVKLSLKSNKTCLPQALPVFFILHFLIFASGF